MCCVVDEEEESFATEIWEVGETYTFPAALLTVAVSLSRFLPLFWKVRAEFHVFGLALAFAVIV